MSKYKSVLELPLHPVDGKIYFNSGRDFREEIFYFLLVDRFHDSLERKSEGNGRRRGFGDPEQLKRFCGGTLQGVILQLEYIKELGCSSIWLSPVLENTPHTYHGYATQNYLDVDPRFGSLTDLKELIEKAHSIGIKVFMDGVINHTGNVWAYRQGENVNYDEGKKFRFGYWRREDRPLPLELRNQDHFQRKGMVVNWHEYPETTEGDFYELKKLRLYDDEIGFKVTDIMSRIFCYWIREVDFDGFRIDAAKHVGLEALARFCTNVKDYAIRLGKKEFVCFAEISGMDEEVNPYLKPLPLKINDNPQHLYGPDTVVDFPLHFILPQVIKGEMPFEYLVKRYFSLEKNILERHNRIELLVTFLDNHDQVGSEYKKRFGSGLSEKQVIGGVGILFFLKGIPCLYYGTEQGLQGGGGDDSAVRECMFDLNDKLQNLHDRESEIYKNISKLAEIRKSYAELMFGRIEFPLYKVYSSISESKKKVLQLIVFKRLLAEQELLIIYNVSLNESVSISVKAEKDNCKTVFGNPEIVKENTELKIFLSPTELVLLKLF